MLEELVAAPQETSALITDQSSRWGQSVWKVCRVTKPLKGGQEPDSKEGLRRVWAREEQLPQKIAKIAKRQRAGPKPLRGSGPAPAMGAWDSEPGIRLRFGLW